MRHSSGMTPAEIAFLAPAATLFAVVIGFVLNEFKGRADARRVAKAKTGDLAAELLNAVFDLKLELGVWESRYRTSNEWKTRWVASAAPIAAALLDQGKMFTAITGGISSALEWRGQAQAAEQALIDGPAARITAVLARLAVSAPLDVREAAAAILPTVHALAATYTGPINHAARTEAETALDTALARFGDAARGIGRTAGSKPQLPTGAAGSFGQSK